jgi:nucleotide-binding universal stress UspA family protein
VVGYEGGEGSRRAVSWAASQLAPHGKLVLVHASRPLHAPPSPFASERERQRFGRALLDELLLEGDDALLETLVHTELSDTDPVSALIDAASRHGAEAIVLGHEPHSRLHAAVGTVTDTLLAQSPVPVTVIPLEIRGE